MKIKTTNFSHVRNKTHLGYADMCEWLQGSDVEESWYLNTIIVVRKVVKAGNLVCEICIS